MVLIPVKWYQLAYGYVPSFTTTGKFVTFADHLHITLWVGGTGLNPVIQHFEESEGLSLEQVVQEYLESAARRVYKLFLGALHAVIYSLESADKLPVRNELNEVVDYVDGKFTSMGLGLAYSQTEATPNFGYLRVEDLDIKLPSRVEPERGREVILRYHRPLVI